MQTEKDSFVWIRKIYEKFGSTTCLLLPQFDTITGYVRVCYFFNVSRQVVFELASSGITLFNMLVKLRLSNIIIESVNNEVAKSFRRYVYRGKEVEGIVKTRMRQYNEIKNKNKTSHFTWSKQFEQIFKIVIGALYD